VKHLEKKEKNEEKRASLPHSPSKQSHLQDTTTVVNEALFYPINGYTNRVTIFRLTKYWQGRLFYIRASIWC